MRVEALDSGFQALEFRVAGGGSGESPRSEGKGVTGVPR